MQRIVETVVSRPGVLRLVSRRFTAHPELADTAIRITGDLARPWAFAAPSLLARLVW